MKIAKRYQIIIIVSILSTVILGTSIGYYTLGNRHSSNITYNTMSNCDGSICVNFTVNSCSGGAILDTKIRIVDSIIIFHQNISSYCRPSLKDPKNFRMGLIFSENEITVREIFTPVTGLITTCWCPFNVNGTITGLIPGNYKLTFLFDNQYVDQVYILKTFEFSIS